MRCFLSILMVLTLSTSCAQGIKTKGVTLYGRPYFYHFFDSEQKSADTTIRGITQVRFSESLDSVDILLPDSTRFSGKVVSLVRYIIGNPRGHTVEASVVAYDLSAYGSVVFWYKSCGRGRFTLTFSSPDSVWVTVPHATVKAKFSKVSGVYCE